ncbi:hypothetical protein QFZ77_002465 [Paenibacillus sp. V4I3]|uniref:hypothetical protein n=1 Tax=Paenibacillus sp. V4I3 TaxID=3042305 RepID=UPI0027810ED5|nr:hypothetical protein [Paenibacillus sp. V4I3]MDQ0873806.1 hypothetical protein [Paenibacillus sp. V4I3]
MGFIKVNNRKLNTVFRINVDNVLYYEPLKHERNNMVIGTKIVFKEDITMDVVETPDEVDRLVKETDNP